MSFSRYLCLFTQKRGWEWLNCSPILDVSRCKFWESRWQLQHRNRRSVSSGEVLSWGNWSPSGLPARDVLWQVAGPKLNIILPGSLGCFSMHALNSFMLAVYTWWTPLAVLHVRRVISVPRQVLRVHLVSVRQDPIVQAETQQAQVENQNVDHAYSSPFSADKTRFDQLQI